MQRRNDTFIELIDQQLKLKDKRVLEIGCGNGAKSVLLAQFCRNLICIDPDIASIQTARQEHTATNLAYQVCRAEKLIFEDETFDVAIFSLSLHHVSSPKMKAAISEAARVIRPAGYIVFLEPTFTGTFFEAELRFGISDGDERKEKAAAYFQMLDSKLLHEEAELFNEISLQFDSIDDFVSAMAPSVKSEALKVFLREHRYELTALRRINIFSKRTDA